VGNHLLRRCWRCGLSAYHNIGQNDHTLVSRVAAARPPWISMPPSPRSLPVDNHLYLKYRIMPSYYLKLSSPPEKISFACLSYLT